jgi:hypothetical protein
MEKKTLTKKPKKSQRGAFSMSDVETRFDRLSKEMGETKGEIGKLDTKMDALSRNIAELKSGMDDHLKYCRSTTLNYGSEISRQSEALTSIKQKAKTTVLIFICGAAVMSAVAAVITVVVLLRNAILPGAAG